MNKAVGLSWRGERPGVRSEAMVAFGDASNDDHGVLVLLEDLVDAPVSGH